MSKNIKPQPPAAAPAYSETPVTDGIQVFTRWSCDLTTVATTDDLKAVTKAMGGGLPPERIENMEEALAQLPTDNPVIAMHVAEIRRIHREVQAPPIDFTKQRTERLKDADALWLKILIIRDVMPKARQAASRTKQVSEFAAKGNKARKKYSEDDKARWRALAETDQDLIRLRNTSAQGCAKAIAIREGLPAGAAETIRKAI